MRATAASLQAGSLAWLQATRTAKSFFGASQATAIHMVLLPAWVRAGPVAQGWLSRTTQPMAYGGTPGTGVWSFSRVAGLTSLILAEGGLAAANLAQSPIEQWTMPAGPMATGLSAAGPGSTGEPSALWPRGWSFRAAVPGAPKPTVVMPSGRKIFSRVRSSQDLPVTFSAMWPAME